MHHTVDELRFPGHTPTIERVYREYTGGMPCEYKTYDEVMHQQYAAQQRMSDILFPVSRW